MTVGMKIKRIREFRKLTQKELGIRCGFTESSADVRIRQYENDSKIPREDTLMIIAKALDVNYITLKSRTTGCAEDIIETLFWLEEIITSVTLFSFSETYDRDESWTFDARYNSFNYMFGAAPVGICISYNSVNRFMNEWLTRQIELRNKEITRDEYFEWKINWPQTCDDNGKITPSKIWRKNS